jgi:hypothetical protein
MSYQTLSNSISCIRNDTHNNIALKLYQSLDNVQYTGDLSELMTRLHDLNSLYDRTVNMQTCLNELYIEAETYGIVKPRFMDPKSHAQNDDISCIQAEYIQKGLNLKLISHSSSSSPSSLTSGKLTLKAKIKPKIKST